jgi:hypothetical protein
MARLSSAYFQRRAAQERDAAARARRGEARRAHLELARLHDQAAAEAACEIIPLKRVSGRR